MPPKKFKESPSPKVLNSDSGRRKRARSSPESLNISKKKDLEKMNNPNTSSELGINQIREMLSDLLDSKLASVASKQDIQELREAYNSMKEENVQLRCELAQLREANLRNEKLLETLDNKLRRQNLIFRGVLKHSPSGKFKRYSEIISEFCSEILKVEIKEDKIHAFPLGSKDNPNSPLLVSFTCFEDKLSVLRAVRILKNTGFVIHQDLAASTRRNRTKLMLVRKELLRLNDQLKTSLRFDGCLTVEGTKFTWCCMKGLCHENNDGVLKLHELAGVDLREFVSLLLKNSLPKDYFQRLRSLPAQLPVSTKPSVQF